MRTIKDIASTKRLTALQKQLILGFCNDADLVTEQDLNQRKIHNRQIFNSCVNALNKGHDDLDKPYINFVADVNDLKDEHDFYVVSTTFGMKYYNLVTNKPAAPAMKLLTMLNIRLNTLDTCYIHGGMHKNHHLCFTGLLLEYPARKYYKVNDYATITAHYAGYKA